MTPPQATERDREQAKSQWQPMETAPKDRQLLAVLEDGKFGIIHWIDTSADVWVQTNKTTQKLERHVDGYWGGFDESWPAYWMEIPSAAHLTGEEESR